MRQLALILVLVIWIGGCATVTMHPEASGKLSSEPTYQESKPFYLWGLVGEHRMDVTEICGDQQVKQMQSQQTAEDGVLAFITLGIYSPHSVKVWCE